MNTQYTYKMTSVMLCNNPTTVGNCGKCKQDITAEKYLQETTTLGLLRVLSKLSWVDKFSDKNQETGSAVEPVAKVNCAGYIKVYAPSTKSCTAQTLKSLVKKVVVRWKQIHEKHNIDNTEMLIVNKVETVYYMTYVQHIQTKLLSLVREVQDLNVCRGVCVSPSKKTLRPTCKFYINDPNTISQMSLQDLVRTFIQLIPASEEETVLKLRPDMKEAYIMCNEAVVASEKFVKCSSVIESLKKYYRYYLRIWLSVNSTQLTSANKVYMHLNAIDNVKYVVDLKALCSEFINLL